MAYQAPHIVYNVPKDAVVCYNCKAWTETNPVLGFGKCKNFDIITEYCAGIVLKTPKLKKICHGFTSRHLVPAQGIALVEQHIP